MFGKLSSLVTGIGTPRAPKKGTVPLPDPVDVPDSVPPLVPSWLSSASSDASSPSPTTPSPRFSPIVHRSESKISGRGCGSPQDGFKAPRFLTPDPALDKARTRRVSTAAPPCQIVKPKPLRAWAIPPPEPITVMTAVVPPLPDAQQLRKGILKPPRPATAVPSEMNRSTTPHSHRSSRSQSVAPPPSPPLRCSKSSLHWQLCPPIEYPTILFPAKKRLSKQILFDVSMPPSCIAFRDVEDAGVVLRGSAAREYTYRHARTGKPLYEMILRCDKIPDLAIRVKAKHSDVIRCRDVYEAIYKSLDRVMSPEELRRYRTGRNFARCEEAFERRCQRIHRGVPSVERAQGMRLVDLLEGDTYFLGLETPPIGSPLDLEGKIWFVNFGPEPQIIDLNNL